MLLLVNELLLLCLRRIVHLGLMQEGLRLFVDVVLGLLLLLVGHLLLLSRLQLLLLLALLEPEHLLLLL